MKIVFMGTPDFAVPALEALEKSGHQVIAVVTQPDKPKGRSRTMSMPPVKEKALELGIPVYQPVKVRDEAFIQILKELAPEAIVVAAFGRILPKQILDIPPYGCINIHGSLLPKYRGAAPIQWAVIDGEKEAGLTTMMMDTGIDTGDMLEKVVVQVAEDETGGSLFEKLSAAGGPLICSTLKKTEEGTLTRTPQPAEGATYAKMLDKEIGDIDWERDAESIERLIRGLDPWPSAYTSLNGKTLKLWKAVVLEDEAEGRKVPKEERVLDRESVPGQVVRAKKDELLVKTGKGILKILSLQLEGKKRMDAGAFLRGYPVEEGTVLTKKGQIGAPLKEV